MPDLTLNVAWGDTKTDTATVTPDPDGKWTWDGTHHYDTPGPYTITVDAAGIKGTADFVAGEQDGGGGTPAKPTLELTDAAAVKGGGPVEWSAHQTNTEGTSEKCVVAWSFAAAGITPDALVLEYEQDKDGQVVWTAWPTTQDGTGKVKTVLGRRGFTIDPTYDSTTNLRVTVPAGTPLADGVAVAVTATTHADSGDPTTGGTLGPAIGTPGTATITIEAAS